MSKVMYVRGHVCHRSCISKLIFCLLKVVLHQLFVDSEFMLSQRSHYVKRNILQMVVLCRSGHFVQLKMP